MSQTFCFFRSSRWMAGLAWALPLAAADAPFQNGSFETPTLGPGTAVSINAPGDAPTGWVPSGTLGNFALFHQSNPYLTAHTGSNSIGFGGNGSTGAGINQTFDTVAGTPYLVSFFTSAQQLGAGPQSYLAQALSGVTVLGSSTGAIPANVAWVMQSFSFVATGTSTRLRFTDTSDAAAAVSLNWALDSVTVTAVPEPGAFALMGAGLLALAWRRHQRRSAA